MLQGVTHHSARWLQQPASAECLDDSKLKLSSDAKESANELQPNTLDILGGKTGVSCRAHTPPKHGGNPCCQR